MTLEPNKKKHERTNDILLLLAVVFVFIVQCSLESDLDLWTLHSSWQIRRIMPSSKCQNVSFYWWAWTDRPYFLASLLATLWMPSISNNVELWKKMQTFGPVKKQYIRPLNRWCRFQSVRWYMLAIKPGWEQCGNIICKESPSNWFPYEPVIQSMSKKCWGTNAWFPNPNGTF